MLCYINFVDIIQVMCLCRRFTGYVIKCHHFYELNDDMITTSMEPQASSRAVKEIEKLSEMTYTVGHSNYKVDMSLLNYECFAWMSNTYVCSYEAL